MLAFSFAIEVACRVQTVYSKISIVTVVISVMMPALATFAPRTRVTLRKVECVRSSR